ncbi:hypothetical protein [Novosphingobium sp. M1R2S20]|uniref:Uncharacterized protein n=1 Tax=Novosphingobium rhizovicinum TaxID=3228928 RepID=A0ABV3RC79_9SPHN
MDLNELLHAHQLEVMKATACQDERQREAHFSVVARYAEEIRKLRKILPETRTVQFPATRETIIYGTYAGSSAPELPSIASDVVSEAAGNEQIAD